MTARCFLLLLPAVPEQMDLSQKLSLWESECLQQRNYLQERIVEATERTAALTALRSRMVEAACFDVEDADMVSSAEIEEADNHRSLLVALEENEKNVAASAKVLKELAATIRSRASFLEGHGVLLESHPTLLTALAKKQVKLENFLASNVNKRLA